MSYGFHIPVYVLHIDNDPAHYYYLTEANNSN